MGCGTGAAAAPFPGGVGVGCGMDAAAVPFPGRVGVACATGAAAFRGGIGVGCGTGGAVGGRELGVEPLGWARPRRRQRLANSKPAPITASTTNTTPTRPGPYEGFARLFPAGAGMRGDRCAGGC